MKKAYTVEQPDVERSPFTGMARQHYIDCARNILERVFTKHVNSFEHPLGFSTIPGGKTYPQPGDPAWCFSSESGAGHRLIKLSGMRRTI